MRVEIHEAKRLPVRREGVVLITGDGRSLPGDVEKFLSWRIPHDVMAIGRSVGFYPGDVLHWANVDGEPCIWWAEHLPKKNRGEFPIRHTLGECRGFDVDWEIIDEIELWSPDEQSWHGSTSLFAVYACLALGYQKIVLAGCPLDCKGHWFFPETEQGPVWRASDYQAWLEFSRDPQANKVKSLSGYTAMMIGEAVESRSK